MVGPHKHKAAPLQEPMWFSRRMEFICIAVGCCFVLNVCFGLRGMPALPSQMAFLEAAEKIEQQLQYLK